MKASFYIWCDKHGNKEIDIEKGEEAISLTQDDAEALYYFLHQELFSDEPREEDVK